MIGICPNCEKETIIELIRKIEEIKIKGEPIKVEMEFYKCSICEEEFEDPQSKYDPLAEAYKEYNRRYNEEIFKT